MDSTAPNTVRSLVEIHNLLRFPEKKRRTVEARMRELGIENGDYERYEEMFLRSREKGQFIIKINGGWNTVKHPWGKGHMLPLSYLSYPRGRNRIHPMQT